MTAPVDSVAQPVPPAGAAAPVREYDPPLQRCPLCSGGPLVLFDRDVYRDNRIDRCAGCGARIVNPQYTDRWLQHYYTGHHSLADRPPADLPHRKNPQVRAAGKRRALELLARHAPRGSILMVGCGDGLELQLAKECGWQPEGFDVDPEFTRALAQRHGVPVYSGALADLVAAGRTYDAVFLDQVIEHPKNPGDYLRAAHALLRPGGVLFLATPNAESLSNRGKTWLGRLGLRGRRRGRHYDSGHHLTGLSPRVLRRLLPKLGFDVVTVRGSLKPQRNPVTALLGRWLPFLDSNFALVARRRG